MSGDAVPPRPLKLRSVTVPQVISPPDGDVYGKDLTIPLSSGLHILYGLNGVGKSRLLRAIRDGRFNVTERFPGSSTEVADSSGAYWRSLWEDLVRPAFGLEIQAGSGLTADAGEYLSYEGGSKSAQFSFTERALAPIVQSFDDYCLVNCIAASDIEYELLWQVLLSACGLAWVETDLLWELLDGIREIFRQADLTLKIRSGTSNDGDSRATFVVGLWATPLPEVPNLWKMKNRVTEVLHQAATEARERYARRIERSGGETSPPGRLEADWNVSYGAGYGWIFNDAHCVVAQEDWDAFAFYWGRDRPDEQRFQVCEFHSSRSWLSVIDESLSDLEEITSSQLLSVAAEFREPTERPQPRVRSFGDLIQEQTASGSPLIEVACAEFERRVTKVYQSLLLDAPSLRVEIRPRGDWRKQGVFLWSALDISGSWVALEELSDTQQRWARFAIKIAGRRESLMSEMSTRSAIDGGMINVLVIDEPERGLHRLAEAHLFAGLANLVESNEGMSIVMSSHSPVFLRHDLAELHHVTRDTAGLLSVKSLEVRSDGGTESLGIPTSELLQHIRKVLVVEGMHEVWVLEHLFGDEFGRAGVLVVPLHGGKFLKSAADSQLLFDFTTAEVVVMLDNLSTKHVEEVWDNALIAREAGENVAKVTSILRGLEKSGEGRYLSNFCIEAIKTQHYKRVGFYMLSETDITRYFKPSDFVSKKNLDALENKSWEHLDAEFEKWLSAGNARPAEGFKGWMRKTYRAEFNEGRFRRAVERLDPPHDDFLGIYQRLC